MTLVEQGGLLMARYGNGSTARWGRIVEAAPTGVAQTERVVTSDGRAMRAAWVNRPGLKQAERLAWQA